MKIPALFSSLVLALSSVVATDDAVGNGSVEVFLFAEPAFFAEVQVEAVNDTCVSLENNLIDGQVLSLLIGGQDVQTVMERTDYWYCAFYDDYACNGTGHHRLVYSDGANNLASANWQTKIHSLACWDDQ